MEAKDLRLNNLIKFEGEIIRVTTIKKYSIGWSKTNFAPNLPNHFQPIELTEGWIIKFGFIAFNGYPVYNDENKNFQIDLAPEECNERYWFFIGNNLEETPYCVSLNYVHELQNLYFSLTGNELEIKTK